MPLETAGKRRRRIEQAHFLSESARLHFATAAWTVRANVRNALLAFTAARQSAELLQAQAGWQQELGDRLQEQARLGAVASMELTTARVAAARAAADLADSKRRLAEARVGLDEAVGVPASALDSALVTFDLSLVPPSTELTSPEARSRALRSRTDILAALAEYSASQSALQLEIAKQYPDLHLGPGYAWNAGSAGENQWELGITVELPLLNRNAGPIAEARARRAAAAARFMALQSKVIGEIDRAVAVLDAARTNMVALQSLLDAQAAQQRSVEAQFRAGAADQLELLGARVQFNTASLTVLDARLKLQQAMSDLEDAVQRPLYPQNGENQ